MLIDTHCHLFNEDYDIDKVIFDAYENGVCYFILGSSDMKDNFGNISLCEKYPNIYTTLGFHPSEASKLIDSDISLLEEYLGCNKVVGIGEIGLDYHAENYDKDKQIEIFVKQLEIADRLGLPFCVHCRNAVDDVYQTLLNNKHLINHSGLMHCYSEGKDWFRKFLDLGLYISFSGNITFKKNDRSFLKNIDLNKLLVETDSPYLSPEPFRGRVNRPKNVRYVIEKIASEIGLSFDELEKITTENAKRFYFKIR